MENQKKQRLHLLDALRGWTLINMILYHGLWDLVNIAGIPMAWYSGKPGYLWQQSICWTFILLSGYCWSMSRNHLRRGLLVFGGGALVSLVTHLLMPESSISFGILTCLGSCMLLMIPMEKLLRRVKPCWGVAVSALLFFLLRNCSDHQLGFEEIVLAQLPDGLYRNMLTAYLGFPMAGFYSADYFPLIPWLALFILGYFLQRICREKGLDQKLFAGGQVPVLNWMGRRSLLIYLLHQPMLYGLCLLYMYLT